MSLGFRVYGLGFRSAQGLIVSTGVGGYKVYSEVWVVGFNGIVEEYPLNPKA